MKRFLLFLFAALALSIGGTAKTVDLGEVQFDRKYSMSMGDSVVAVMHVSKDGIMRVMCNGSDYPFPYADPERTQLMDYSASFYDGAQGYVMKVHNGDVIYFMRPFCMGGTRVWFEMQSSTLTYTASPAEGQRLVPTGRAQIELGFNMPVVTSGGTMTCGGQTVQLEAHSANLYILYEIKDIVMGWIDRGIAPGTPITVTLRDVHAAVDESVKYGSDGTIVLRYTLPDAPGRLLRTNFEERTFKSYWLPDDEEGVFRLTFSKPVSQTNPGYLSIVYGDPESMDAGQLFYNGYADGYDVCYDLRGINMRPKDIIESGTVYPSIMLRPGGVCSSDGELMFSEGIGTLASWTYEIPYVYLQGDPTWLVTYEDESSITRLNKGDGLLIYVFYYNLVRSDGILLTFADGRQVHIPMSDVEVNWETNGMHAELFFEIPDVDNASDRVTISFDNFRLLNGEPDPGKLRATYAWTPSIPTAVGGFYNNAVSVPAYDLSGRRVSSKDGTRRTHVIRVEAGKKVVD